MNRHPANAISEDQVKQYEEDGVICLRGMFDADWCQRMYDASIRYMESGQGRVREVKQDDDPGRFYSNVFMLSLIHI